MVLKQIIQKLVYFNFIKNFRFLVLEIKIKIFNSILI